MATKYESDIVKYLRSSAKYIQNLLELRDDVLKDDRLALIFMYAISELLIDFLIEKLCRRGSTIVKNYRPSFMVKVILINEIGIINDELFDNLKTLKEFRDKAAHSTKKIRWECKFSFNQQNKNCKGMVDALTKEKNGLKRDLYYVWWALFTAGIEAFNKKHMVKMKSITKEITKNNK